MGLALLGLVLFVIANTYAVTLLVAKTDDPRHRRLLLVTGITISLSVLAIFKYYNFVDHSLSIPTRIQDLVLPIGISFYIFHSLSYMIDTYRRKIVPTTNFGDVALYILFFPQLWLGRSYERHHLLPQMRKARLWSDVRFKFFLLMFLIGYFKKAVISDNLSPFVDAFYTDAGHYGAADAAIAAVFYAIQIYCDFSGYTDMAIATAGTAWLPAQAQL